MHSKSEERLLERLSVGARPGRLLVLRSSNLFTADGLFGCLETGREVQGPSGGGGGCRREVGQLGGRSEGREGDSQPS